MKRIIIICEGQTEQEFCNTILSPYFSTFDIHIQAPLIKKSMGGVVKWGHLKKQIDLHLKSDPTAHVTTFLDYYGLSEKHEFPVWKAAKIESDKLKRMEIIEEGMLKSIDSEHNYRFLPYIQLHEFEGLLFNDINIFYDQIPEEELKGIEELKTTFEEFDNPELINDNKETSPSARLERIILGYNKVIYGSLLAEAIGLENIRKKSPRFNEWLSKIEEIE